MTVRACVALAGRCYDRLAMSGPTPTGPRPTTAEVRREERGAKGGRWVLVVDGHESEMTYSRASPTLIIIDHTAVNDALRGRGVGAVLVERAVEDARQEGFKIIPLCPFAKSQFERHAEWKDVLSR
jgi:predicted GNAT family acetyltransferase